VTFGLALALAGLVVPLLARSPDVAGSDRRRWILPTALALVLAGVVHDLAPQVSLDPLVAAFARLALPGLAGHEPAARAALVGALVWCGPAADLVVRQVLMATGLPAPEQAAAAGLRAGRWIGRLERWLLVACVAAGQPALAVLPIGGKALFRYAEVVADARAAQPRLTRPDGNGDPAVNRESLIDYVIVGSLASWLQAIGLGLLVGTGV
jgi:hypothetical protein